MAATLAETLRERNADDASSRRAAAEILKELRPKLIRMHVRCDAACSISVDGFAVGLKQGPRHVFYLEPGRHAVDAELEGGARTRRVITGSAGEEIELTIDRPEGAAATSVKADERPPPARARGLSRAWFWTGAGVTTVLAGITIWSGLDVNDAHDAYVAQPSEAGYEDGLDRQLRTNILIGATGVAAAATLVIAVFTDWSSAERATGSGLTVAPIEGGALVQGALAW